MHIFGQNLGVGGGYSLEGGGVTLDGGGQFG